jgi:hypothetical protein
MAIPEGSTATHADSSNSAAVPKASQQLQQQASDDEEKCLLTPTSLTPGLLAFSQVLLASKIFIFLNHLINQSETDDRPEAEEPSRVGPAASPSPQQQFFMNAALIYSEPALPSASLANTPLTIPHCHWAYSDMTLAQV